jgi:hypothetical protein
MSDSAITLEDSNGTVIHGPSAADIRSALERIGRDLEHCILDLGASGGFVQAAGSRGRLTLQYRDETGMYESARSDLDAATAERVFTDALNGSYAWKNELQFKPMDEGAPPTPAGDGAAPSAAPSSGPRKSLAEDLMDAARREAASKLKGLVGKGIRGLFNKK